MQMESVLYQRGKKREPSTSCVDIPPICSFAKLIVSQLSCSRPPNKHCLEETAVPLPVAFMPLRSEAQSVVFCFALRWAFLLHFSPSNERTAVHVSMPVLSREVERERESSRRTKRRWFQRRISSAGNALIICLFFTSPTGSTSICVAPMPSIT